MRMVHWNPQSDNGARLIKTLDDFFDTKSQERAHKPKVHINLKLEFKNNPFDQNYYEMQNKKTS